jgi:hypothetical protein
MFLHPPFFGTLGVFGYSLGFSSVYSSSCFSPTVEWTTGFHERTFPSHTSLRILRIIVRFPAVGWKKVGSTMVCNDVVPIGKEIDSGLTSRILN